MADQVQTLRDLSLKLRLDAVQKSLEQIRAVDEAVRGRREEIQQLYERASGRSGIQFQLRMIQLKLAHSLELLAPTDEDSPGELILAESDDLTREVLRDLREASNATAKLIDATKIMSSVIGKMEGRWNEIPLEGLQEVNTTLSNKCEQRIKRVKQIEDRLAQASLAEDEPANLWREYEDIAFRDGERLFAGERLFSEYVDFLGGLALRNTGIDNGTCYMADELLRTCHRFGGMSLWHSMTVPSRRSPPETTLVRIIRLGFPEWTIWAVPIGAHEYGHMVVSQNEELKRASDKLRASLPRIEVYLADCFATYFMGPSYAFASILVALDPCAEGPGDNATSHATRSPESERAHIVLRMLQSMDSQVYQGVVEVLESHWRAALAVFGFPFPLPAPEAEPLNEVVKLMQDFLDNAAPHLQYKPSQWQKVTEWPSLVSPPDDFPLGPTDDVRDVINGAWHQRLRDKDRTTGLAADELGQSAQELWRARLSSSAGFAGLGPRSVR